MLYVVVVCLLVSFLLALSPSGLRVESGVTSVGGVQSRDETRTGKERIVSRLTVDNVMFLVAPVAVAAGPIFFRRRRGAIFAGGVSAVVLATWVLLLFFPWYLPAAALMAAAAATAAGQEEASPVSEGSDNANRPRSRTRTRLGNEDRD